MNSMSENTNGEKSNVSDNKAINQIGIINLCYTNNYGAVIAAAVLEDVVRSITENKYIVSTINYFPCKDFSSRFLRICDEAKQWGGWKIYFNVRFNKNSDTSSTDSRGKRFEEFKNTFLNLTEPYNDAFEIAKNQNYYAFIVGSDVVWATKRVDNFRADGYFLKFADDSVRKIAYAPSIDNKIDNKLKRKAVHYKNGLKYLDAVSVREKDNVQFLQNLTDKKVYECCDPAFLVDSDYYLKMIKTAKVKPLDEKYIYVYILELNQNIVDYANKLAKEKKLKICYYSSLHKEYDANSEDCTSDGPAEFLYRLKNAEYVLTNSFHCVVFSLLFKKKFLSFSRSEISIKSDNLLKKFGLLNRLTSDGQAVDIDDEIDFSKTDDIISKMKSESINYLKKSLNN